MKLKKIEDLWGLVQKIGDKQRELERARLSFEEFKREREGAYAYEASKLTAEIAGLKKQVQDFCESRELLVASELRSMKGVVGSFGYRRSHVLEGVPEKRTAGYAGLVEKVEAALPEAVLLEKSLDVQYLKRLPETDLGPLGLKVVERDTFYVEAR